MSSGYSTELTGVFYDNSFGGVWSLSTSIFGNGDYGTPGLENSTNTSAVNFYPEQINFESVDTSMTKAEILYIENLISQTLSITNVLCENPDITILNTEAEISFGLAPRNGDL